MSFSMEMILAQCPHTKPKHFFPLIFPSNKRIYQDTLKVSNDSYCKCSFHSSLFFFLNHKWLLLLEGKREDMEGPETSTGILGSTHQLLAEMETYFLPSIPIFKITTIRKISSKKHKNSFIQQPKVIKIIRKDKNETQSSFQKPLVMSPGPIRSAVEAVVLELYFGLKIHFSG